MFLTSILKERPADLIELEVLGPVSDHGWDPTFEDCSFASQKKGELGKNTEFWLCFASLNFKSHSSPPQVQAEEADGSTPQ